jgi:uncharacterized RDD family membrane protein YckC
MIAVRAAAEAHALGPPLVERAPGAPRLWAALLDFLLLAVAGGALAAATLLPLRAFADAHVRDATAAALILFLLAGAAAYYTGCWHYFGATPGQHALGLRVVNEWDAPPTVVQAVGRCLARALSLLLGLGMLWAFGHERRTWHDLLADTYVVRARPASEAGPRLRMLARGGELLVGLAGGAGAAATAAWAVGQFHPPPGALLTVAGVAVAFGGLGLLGALLALVRPAAGSRLLRDAPIGYLLASVVALLAFPPLLGADGPSLDSAVAGWAWWGGQAALLLLLAAGLAADRAGLTLATELRRELRQWRFRLVVFAALLAAIVALAGSAPARGWGCEPADGTLGVDDWEYGLSRADAAPSHGLFADLRVTNAAAEPRALDTEVVAYRATGLPAARRLPRADYAPGESRTVPLNLYNTVDHPDDKAPPLLRVGPGDACLFLDLKDSPGPRVLFRDDFTRDDSGWPYRGPVSSSAERPASDDTGADQERSASGERKTPGRYVDGEYAVALEPGTDEAALALLPHEFRDFDLNLDARLTPPVEQGIVEVVLRRRPSGLYQLWLDPNGGSFALVRVRRMGTGVAPATTSVDLIPWTRAAAIQPGDAWNHVGVRAQGPDLIVWINGQEVGRARDDTFRAGQLGLGVWYPADSAAEVRFRDLVVTSVE